MKAVILAAGEGSRLRPFTETRPKVMLPVANRPIMEYKVRTLSRLGIDEIVMIVGYRKEKVQSHFEDGDEWGVDIEYVEQRDQIGTADAVRRVRDLVGKRFLVINGDNLIHPDAIERFVKKVDAGNGVLLRSGGESTGYGVVFTENGDVKRIEEKPADGGTGKINLGVYIFTREIFDAIDATDQSVRGEYEITTSIQHLIDGGHRVKGVEMDATWIDAVYPWDLVKVNEAVLDEADDFYLERSIEGRVEDGAVVRGPVALGKGSVVRSGAYVIGPVVIGENCEIGPGTSILPSTSIGKNATIGPGSVVSNSLVMQGTRLGALSSVEDSVLGYGSKAGSHFVSDSGRARVVVKDRVYTVEDVGGMVADSADIGGSVTLSPGRIVGRGCEVLPGTVVKENVESGSRLTG